MLWPCRIAHLLLYPADDRPPPMAAITCTFPALTPLRRRYVHWMRCLASVLRALKDLMSGDCGFPQPASAAGHYRVVPPRARNWVVR